MITPPNLIEVQNNSYAEFLQSEIDPKKRENLGLQAVFNEVFPIESYDGKCVLEFSHYEIGGPSSIGWSAWGRGHLRSSSPCDFSSAE